MHNPIQPLTESDFDRLERLLSAIHAGRTITLPEIDGYFCALACGPNRESMDARLGHLLGDDFSHGLPFYSLQSETGEARKLLTRLWETVAASLMSGQPYFPRFDLDGQGRPAGTEWIAGFIRGMNRDPFLWDAFLRKQGNVPIATLLGILVAEANPDLIPGGIGPQIPPERRIELLAGIVACLAQFSRHFHPNGRVAELWNSGRPKTSSHHASARRPFLSGTT